MACRKKVNVFRRYVVQNFSQQHTIELFKKQLRISLCFDRNIDQSASFHLRICGNPELGISCA